MTELVDVLEQQYALRLEQRCKEWEVKHPAEAKVIRDEVAVKFARVGKPEPEPDTLAWHVIEGAVQEAIRLKAAWPSVRQWMLTQNPTPEPIAPRKPVPPAVEGEDAKPLYLAKHQGRNRIEIALADMELSAAQRRAGL